MEWRSLQGNWWEVIIKSIGDFSAVAQLGAIFFNLKKFCFLEFSLLQDIVNKFPGRLSIMKIVIEFIIVVLHFGLFYFIWH